MNFKNISILALIILFDTTLYATKEKVIVFAIDGMRADLLLKLKLSFFEKMNSTGFGTYNSTNSDITISGPSWTSVITGVRHEKHKIIDNQFNNLNIANLSSIPKIGKEMNSNLKFGMFMEWDKFYHFNKNIPWDTLIKGDFGNTRSSTEIIKKWIETTALDYYFIYLGEPDYWGHLLGFETYNPFYINSFKKINYSIEEIIKTINLRQDICNEKWLILTTTDHGGKGRHHNGTSKQEKQIYWFASFLENYNSSISYVNRNSNYLKISTASLIQPKHPDIFITSLNFLCKNKFDYYYSNFCCQFDGISWLNQLNTHSNSNIQTDVLTKN